MARQLKNLGSALKDSKSRVLLVLIFFVVIVGLIIGWLSLKKSSQEGGAKAVAGVTNVPSIRSTPGVGTPSQEYVKTVQQSDVLAAQQAASEGKSAIPTLTRTAYIGAESSPIPGIPTGEGGKATKTDCSVAELQRARQAGVRAEELRLSGCDAAALRAAGYTAGELLNAGFSAKELRAAGFSAKELKEAGFSAAELKEAGFTAGELVAAGFSAIELSQAGFTASELAAIGINNAKALGQNKDKDCSPQALQQARSAGVSAAQLRARGCGVNALRLAGFNAQELRDAGFSAGELRRAGFTIDELKNAGFDANDLRNAGESARALIAAGFSANELEAIGVTQGELLRAGVSPAAAPPTYTRNNTSSPVAIGTLGSPGSAGSSGLAGSSAGGDGQPFSSGAERTSLPAAPTDPALQQLQQLQQRQAAQLSAQERLEAIQHAQDAMNSQSGDLFSSWSPPTAQQYVEGKPPEVMTAAQKAAAAATAQALAAAQAAPIIRAGTILFATLDTTLDSDEPGPILATIVQGDLKGAKLLGQFQRQDTKVILNFTTLVIPSFPNSLGINAVAIDPDTARTALASNVDRHILMRYGSLMGAAFFEGLGEATMQSGSTFSNNFVGYSTSTAVLSGGQKAIVAIGQVGQKLGNATASYFNTPPTVTVNAGEGIGILFMADASLANDQPAAIPVLTGGGKVVQPAAGAAAGTTTTTTTTPVASQQVTLPAAPQEIVTSTTSTTPRPPNPYGETQPSGLVNSRMPPLPNLTPAVSSESQ